MGQVNFVLDFLHLFFERVDTIDENLNRSDPTFDSARALEVIDECFVAFNIPLPEATVNLIQADCSPSQTGHDHTAKGLDDQVQMINVDALLMVVLNQWGEGAVTREAELKAVFQSFDKARENTYLAPSVVAAMEVPACIV